MTPKDSVELHNLPLVVNVKLKKRDDTGEMANEIKGYSKRETPLRKALPGREELLPGNDEFDNRAAVPAEY